MSDVMFSLLNIGMTHYLVLGFLLFTIAIFGVVVCKNTLKILILIEIMLNAVCLNFVAFAHYIDSEVKGMIFAIFIIATSAAQLALGVAFVFAVNKYKKTVDVEAYNELRG